ncbi:hypothetical protein CXG81DRAFT_14080, partial [Caulochytrium protostelioides]
MQNNPSHVLDAPTLLEEYLQSIDNIPAELAHLLHELEEHDREFHQLRSQINQEDLSLRRLVKHSAILDGMPDGIALFDTVQRRYEDAMALADEKIQLAQKPLELIERHLARLNAEMRRMVEMAEKTGTPVPPGAAAGDARRGREHRRARQRGEQPPREPQERARRRRRRRRHEARADEELYCFCRQVSYGEMIACDSETCETEWFHLECVGLTESPKGTWYCPTC